MPEVRRPLSSEDTIQLDMNKVAKSVVLPLCPAIGTMEQTSIIVRMSTRNRALVPNIKFLSPRHWVQHCWILRANGITVRKKDLSTNLVTIDSTFFFTHDLIRKYSLPLAW
mmetsp:Transcript_30424/g.55038  ORF Transcript_30424/g.55038 Transcript_30424/m.55038 type:complete len:111 (-) Transcript_30424:740-1072(-)